jgi:predicted nucleic acid-binding protein
MLKVVSNSSPIIHLNKLGYLHLLETLYKKVYITRWVSEECTSDSQQTPGIVEEIEIIKKASFIEISDIENSILFLTLSKLVDEGEASAITLALEKQADLILLDETDGRELADVHNLNYIGTIGILLKAREMELIALSVPEILNNLKGTGFYLNKKLEKFILENS